MNTRQLENDDGLLGTFLHEQFHWFAEARRQEVETAIARLCKLYPDVPIGAPEGAKSEFSTYLHLIICAFELEALQELIGADRARGTITTRPYYTWVYRQVLNQRSGIRQVLENCELSLP